MSIGWNIALTPSPTITFTSAPANGAAIVVTEFALPANGGASNAFAIGAWGPLYGFPSEVEFYADRLTFASTPAQPQTLWFSKTGAYGDFGRSQPIVDDDAITATINARQLNDIRELVPLSSLLVMTGGGEWRVTGGQDDVITPTSISAKPQSYHGSGVIPALVVGEGALFVQDRGRTVRDIGYSFDVDGFRGADLTVFAEHLMRGREIKAWAYQQIPHSIVWVVMTDGALLSLTYVREQEVVGWTRHDTDGTVEDVAVLPEGDQDAVYVTVVRNGARRIERLAGQQIDCAVRGIHLDSHLSYDGDQPLPLALFPGPGDDWSSDALLQVTINLGAAAVFSPASVGREIVLGRSTDDPLRLEIVQYVLPAVVRVRASRNVPPEFRGGPQQWALAVQVLAGLDHLEGKTVVAVADGHVHRSMVVSSGAVTLDWPASIVHVGLPYTALMETLEVNDPGDEPMSMRAVMIRRVGIKVLSSRNIKAGPSEARLQEFEPRETEALTRPPDSLTRTCEVWIDADWATRGRVTVVQDQPLPLQVLSMALDLERGER